MINYNIHTPTYLYIEKTKTIIKIIKKKIHEIIHYNTMIKKRERKNPWEKR